MVKERVWSPESYIGMTAKDVIVEILRLNPHISRIRLVSYIPREKPRESLEKLLETGIPDEEWDIRIPRWVNLIPARRDPREVIQEILDSSTNKLVGVQSKVEYLGHYIQHVPMVDFNFEVNQANLAKVKEALNLMCQKDGFILSSGRSFHYYSSHLLDEKEWQSFMGQSLLTGLVEPRYVGHSLIQGAATLRISAGLNKPKEPEVVATL